MQVENRISGRFVQRDKAVRGGGGILLTQHPVFS